LCSEVDLIFVYLVCDSHVYLVVKIHKDSGIWLF